MNELIQIDELCPHCRIPLHMQKDEGDARAGFTCPTCKKGLIWIGNWGKRLQAVMGFGLGGVLVMWLFFLFLMVGVLVVLMIKAHWRAHYLLFGGVSALYLWLFVVVGRWAWSSQRTLLSVVSGKRLIPARKDGKLWRFDITPSRPKFKRKRGRDEALDGAMTEHLEHRIHAGALSLDDGPDEAPPGLDVTSSSSEGHIMDAPSGDT